jgi:hypothetical protein
VVAAVAALTAAVEAAAADRTTAVARAAATLVPTGTEITSSLSKARSNQERAFSLVRAILETFEVDTLNNSSGSQVFISLSRSGLS